MQWSAGAIGAMRSARRFHTPETRGRTAATLRAGAVRRSARRRCRHAAGPAARACSRARRRRPVRRDPGRRPAACSASAASTARRCRRSPRRPGSSSRRSTTTSAARRRSSRRSSPRPTSSRSQLVARVRRDGRRRRPCGSTASCAATSSPCARCRSTSTRCTATRPATASASPATGRSGARCERALAPIVREGVADGALRAGRPPAHRAHDHVQRRGGAELVPPRHRARCATPTAIGAVLADLTVGGLLRRPGDARRRCATQADELDAADAPSLSKVLRK